MKKILVTVLILACEIGVGLAQQTSYLVTPGNGYGLKFWSDDAYKIHMGSGTEYFYGPVTDYSIKTNMSGGTPNRGWTWGVAGQVPVAAINATGNMQIAGTFATQGISLDRSSWPYILFSENGVQGARIQGTGGMFAVTSTNGASNWLTVNSTSGNVGIGTSTPSAKLHVGINGTNTNYAAYTGADVGMVLRNSNSTTNNLNLLAFTDASGWGVADMGTITNHGSHSAKLFFSTRPSGSGPVQRMLIDENGNVGIGTTTPGNSLSVKGRIGIRADAPPSAATETMRIEGAISTEENVVNVTNLIDQDFVVRLSSVGSANKRTIIGPSVSTRFSLGVGINASNEYLTIVSGGNVGIGTVSPDAKLAVNGQVHATEVKVTTTVPGPDYVFLKTYSLRSLKDVESYIEENQHLPEVPSAAEMEKDGIKVGEMNMLLLKKVEELTLYVIDLKKELEAIKAVGVKQNKK